MLAIQSTHVYVFTCLSKSCSNPRQDAYIIVISLLAVLLVRITYIIGMMYCFHLGKLQGELRQNAEIHLIYLLPTVCFKSSEAANEMRIQ